MTKAKTKTPELFGDTAVAEKPKPAPVAQPAKPKGEVAKPSRAKTGKPAGTAVSTEVKAPQDNNLLAVLSRAAADPNVQPEKMHTLLDARDRLMRQEAHVQFVTAYIALRADLPVINAKGRIEIPPKPGKKKQDTPYATYKEIQRVTAPILAQHKFAMMMLPDVGKDNIGVLMRGKLAYVCDTQYGRMVHVEECAIASPLETSGSKNNTQGVGSALAYTKRYAAVALLDLVSEAVEDRDDDGRATGKAADADVVEALSPAQVKKLSAAIADCGVDIQTFRDKYEVGSLMELPPAMLQEALDSCSAFKERNSKRTPDAKTQ